MAALKKSSKKASAKSPTRRDIIQETRDAARAARNAKLEALTADIKQKMVEVIDAFYDIGLALREILEEKLYLAGGYRSFEAFLLAHGLFARSQAAKLIAVVKNVPRAKALLLGAEKSYALVAYTRETPEADSPAEIVDGGSIGGKKVGEASLRDIEAATREVRAKKPVTEAARARAVATAKGIRAEWPSAVAAKWVEG